MLFKGKRAVDAGMRWFMKSEYNHSALVVNVHGELQLFEATASGVGCCPLEFYVNAFYWLEMSSRFHTIAVRRLYCEFPEASGGDATGSRRRCASRSCAMNQKWGAFGAQPARVHRPTERQAA